MGLERRDAGILLLPRRTVGEDGHADDVIPQQSTVALAVGDGCSVAHQIAEGGEGAVFGSIVKDAHRDVVLAAFGARDVGREPVEHGDRPTNGGRFTWRVADERRFYL